MSNLIDQITSEQLRNDVPDFRPGDTVRVHAKVVEGERERIQLFDGVVIQRRGAGISETYTVRKISNGVGVERTFPVHTPRVAKIEVLREGKVRRAKLFTYDFMVKLRIPGVAVTNKNNATTVYTENPNQVYRRDFFMFKIYVYRDSIT